MLGLCQNALGNYSYAISLMKEALDLRGGSDWELHLYLARIFIKDNYDNAFFHLKEAEKEHDDHVLYLLLSLCYQEKKEYINALLYCIYSLEMSFTVEAYGQLASLITLITPTQTTRLSIIACFVNNTHSFLHSPASSLDEYNVLRKIFDSNTSILFHLIIADILLLRSSRSLSYSLRYISSSKSPSYCLDSSLSQSNFGESGSSCHRIIDCYV